jgi:glycosyltransferase involved in cell wall biosynthesis
MKNTPSISIIIPLYNAESYIEEAINSVINQSFRDWELIIVDNGSTDNSLSTARAFASDQITIYSTENNGAAAARNCGLRKSRGQFIKFFDADDLISDNMLESQFNLATRYPDSIISASWGRFYENDIQTFRLNEEECWKDMTSIEWICSSWREAQTMTQPGIFLIPRQIIDKVGLWNEKLSLVDDMEFFTKIILGAKGIKFSSKAILYYRSGMGTSALSGHTTRKAIESYFLSLQLSTSYLLNLKDDVTTRLCAANMWQGFIYEYYGLAKDLSMKAELNVSRLGGSDLSFPCGGKTKILNTLFGWKLTLLIKKYL